MATLYKRLTHLSKEKKFTRLSTEQTRQLGRLVIEYYWSIKKPETPVHHAEYSDENGTYRVVSYPRYFIPEMDRIIVNFCKKLTPRKRSYPQKVYSAKPSKSNNS